MRKTLNVSHSNSIQQRESGRMLPTVLTEISQMELAKLSKDWLFDWINEASKYKVYKLTTAVKKDNIEGLITYYQENFGAMPIGNSNRMHLDENAANRLIKIYFKKIQLLMKFIKDPEGMDLSVVHKHLSDEEAEEISAFIQQYKANLHKQPIEVKVKVADKKELEFLLSLFKRLNIQWTLTET